MKNTTKTKQDKRTYTKKTLLTQDELWKVIIPLLWDSFLRFTLEDWADKIDFTRKPDMLDKEMKRLMLRGKAKNRAVDILMRVYMKDGTSKPFLFHIEVQGYPDAYFKRRLFQYYYRIDDLLQEPIEVLAIMIDEDPENLPNDYEQAFGQTSVYFKFRMLKLLNNPPPYHGKENNPFSIVFEVAWRALKQHRLKTDEDLMALKFRLIKRLLENETDGETIYALFDFINIYLPFGDKEKSTIFERELDLLIDKDNDMEAVTIREFYFRKIRDKAEKEIKVLRKSAEKEARMRQEEAQRREEAERKLIDVMLELHNEGFSIEKIATMMRQSQDSVQKVIDKK